MQSGPFRLRSIFVWTATLLIAGQSNLSAQTIYEIWTPEISQTGSSTFGTCFFRKQLSLVNPEEGQLYIAAKDTFELFINGNPVDSFQSQGEAFRYDIGQYLQSGVNVIAIRVDHQSSVTAGLAAKFRVRETGEDRWRSLTTDETWVTAAATEQPWTSPQYNDRNWKPANRLASVKFKPDQVAERTATEFSPKSLVATNDAQRPEPNAQPNSTQPAASQSAAVDNSQDQRRDSGTKKPAQTRQQVDAIAERFKIDPEFQVQQVMTNDETGSLIAMAFNEFGEVILSREGGGLFLADVTKEPGDLKRIRLLCNEVNSCQGILPLNGKIYVTGDGPDGLGLYRLTDADRDGMFEVEKRIVPFAGKLSEHGPHGIELGPDGMIYVVVGNASGSKTQPKRSSPYFNTYEGDLIPRLEDPGGHAVGVKAPGGTVIRTTPEGDFVETVCGGVRNVYDLVFDQHGELFLHDSDLETNIGMAWYRPTRIYHVPHGAELGWRSGWAKFPNYFADVTPPVVETGRGSPSGAILYQHFQFPARYHNCIFFADWSEGRILSVKPQPKGAGYIAEAEVFVSGRPMNVTDLDVGMDGTLFFCTGGRGTSGGVYRIAWKGDVPEELYTYQNDFEQVIRMPQPRAAWGRQATAMLKKKLADQWQTTLEGIASDERNETDYRLRALDLLYFYGPFPSDELIDQLATADDFRIRARVASLCGAKDYAPLNDQLNSLIEDRNSLVRRKAAESMFRIKRQPPVNKVVAMLGSTDKAETTVARRLLEKTPEVSFRDQILKSEEVGVFVNGSLALLNAHPSLDNSYQVLARVAQFMDGFLNDAEFTDLLRLSQIALIQGEVSPDRIPGFGARISNEFPAGNGNVNKQLAMIMAFLKQADVGDRIEEYFETSDNSDVDKLFVAMQLHSIGESLGDSSRFAIIDYLEQSIRKREGSTYRSYIGTAIKELAVLCDEPAQIAMILEYGARWPNAMLQSFFSFKEPLSEDQVQLVIDADRDMPDGSDSVTRRIRLGSIAMLAESNSDNAHQYLREIWKARPSFRNEITLGLAERPDGPNWAYLVTSLPILDDTIGQEIVQALQNVNRRPKQPRQYRELIEMGYRLRDNGAFAVSMLMKHWTGNQSESSDVPGSSWQAAMEHWTAWYQDRWPDELPVNVEPLPKVGNYTAEQVLAHLEEFQSQGIAGTGRFVFQKANCAACHRLGSDGATFGPDLSNLAARFSQREILESIIHPSRVVPDQYRSRKILTIDGDQLFGMLTRDSSGAYLLLDPDGKTTRISKEDIEEIADSDLSSMPDGLLDNLSLDEILHLFAYLNGSEKPVTSAENTFDPSSIR